ncbi:membrane protein [Streptomyces sp. NRRL B-3648]|nr:membrane protein [Streptomyces sp. NRRL B-3648]
MRTPPHPLPHEKCAVRSLPLPLALTARLSPVAVLACAGWALTSGPVAPPAAAGHQTAQKAPAGSTGSAGSASDAPSPGTAARTYATAPAPCAAVPAATVRSLVPGVKPAGKEIPSTDTDLRRTCSWNALQGYDYRWLDVSYEIGGSEEEARKEYEQRVAEKSGGGAVPGLGDSAYSVVNLTTEDKQQTREGVVLVRAANALVVVTYNGSDFETKKAPGTDEINKGAIKAAKSAVAALGGGQG